MANENTGASVHLLTGGEIVIDGATGVVRGAAQKSLFLLLALDAGRPLSRERIATTLWPDADPKAARANLRAALLTLRRALEGHGGLRIDATSETITLLGVSLDIAEFKRLAASDRPGDWRRALQLYKGDFRPDLHTVSEDLNALFEIERERWRSVAISTAERLLESLERAGESDDALVAAQTLLRIDPAHEPTHRLVMRLHVDRGDRVSALRQFEQCRAALREAYDLQPSAETRALRNRIAERGSDASHPRAEADEGRGTAVARELIVIVEKKILPRLGRRSVPWLLLGGALCVALIAAMIIGGRGGGLLHDEGNARPILAVEPFTYDDVDPGLETYVEALRAALLIDIAIAGGALVTVVDSPDWRSSHVWTEFHLRGSIQRRGDRVRAAAQLVAARDQTVIWADAETGVLDDPEGMSGLIARAALNALTEAGRR